MLQFSPTAWAKLLFLRDYGETEVGGFGICPNDPLLVEDIELVRQHCSSVTVDFDDESVADLFDRQVDVGLRPEQFARIWIHTHPGNSARPSQTDEDTLTRVFDSADWAVMFILACGGETYARLRMNVGPRADIDLAVGVDFTIPFEGSDVENWAEDYSLNVNAIDESYWEVEFPISNRQQFDNGAAPVDPDDYCESMYFHMLEEEEFAHGSY